MSADENVNQAQLGPYYHGTNTKLEPGKDTIRVDPYAHLGYTTRSSKRNYFTGDKATADHLGKYTYTVRPTGAFEPDDGGMIKSHKTREPLEILSREDTPDGR